MNPADCALLRNAARNQSGSTLARHRLRGASKLAHHLAVKRIQALQARLLAWYRENARDLPWRRTEDPYAIWLSEVMLQQTRVNTVIPYYERFLHRWPTVRDLAEAPLDEISAAWSGLGYYRRAKALHEAAGAIAREHHGKLPSEPAQLRKLPGFGAYTTGAVASIAFDRPVAAIDGNVERVLARIEGIETDPKQRPAAGRIADTADRIAQTQSPGLMNQALIELGALICKRPPQCEQCPVRDLCSAFQTGKTQTIPPPRRRKPQKVVHWDAVVLALGHDLLLEKRPEGEPFAGLWCPVLVPSCDAPEAELKARGFGLDGPLQSRGSLTHILTHRQLETRVFEGRLRKPPSGDRLGLFSPHDVSQVALPTFSVKVLHVALKERAAQLQLPRRGGKTGLDALGGTL